MFTKDLVCLNKQYIEEVPHINTPANMCCTLSLAKVQSVTYKWWLSKVLIPDHKPLHDSCCTLSAAEGGWHQEEQQRAESGQLRHRGTPRQKRYPPSRHAIQRPSE